MERTTSQLSEKELAEKVIHLHDSGLGFRRIARELTAQGYKMGKDRANKLFDKYKTTTDTDVGEDEELRQLRRAETKARQQLANRKEKEELRKRLTILFVEKETLTFERRRKLFTDEKKLLRFAAKAIGVLYPMAWAEFKEFCEEEDLDLAAALSTALADQQDYESSSVQNGEVKKRLDVYLREEIEEFINLWEEDDCEECEKEEDETEPKATATQKEENVTVIFPAPAPL